MGLTKSSVKRVSRTAKSKCTLNWLCLQIEKNISSKFDSTEKLYTTLSLHEQKTRKDPVFTSKTHNVCQ